MGKQRPYTEELLHWLWEKRYLQNEQLFSENGKKVSIHHPGYPNASDGPDFVNARVKMGSLMWHGDIEIHWRAKDWFYHEHHTDKNYNRVILHVVFDDSKPVEVRRQDETVLPTLYMKPHLSKPLQYFFNHFQRDDTLPCAGNLSSIPKEILQQQFEKAQREYFEQKVNDLLEFYDASLPLSEAWQNMLIIALFDGLGISHNREPMRKLARILLQQELESSIDEVTDKALKIAGIDPENSGASYRWKRKGSRPTNHPKNRIRQGCEMLFFIKNSAFIWWLRTDITQSFKKMLKEVTSSPGIGSHRSGVLIGTVWTPACYLLGDLTATKKITNQARKLWLNHRTRLPSSILKPFKKADIPAETYRKKLGTVHQFRSYCKPHRCQQCKVFKYLISS